MIDDYRITTPDAVSIAYDVARIGSRFVATVVDTAIIVATLTAISVGSFALGAAFGGVSGAWADAALILWSTLTFVLIFGYYIIFETLWSGRTPGKRFMELRVLKTSGYPIGFVDAAIRNLARIADFLPLLYGVGVLVMFISPESRRLGDYAAGTIVVKERTLVALRDLTPPTPRAPVPPRGSIDPEELQWDLRGLTQDDLGLITELLARLPSLTPQAGQTLSAQIAERVAHRISAREPANAVQFLQRVLQLREMEEV